MKKNQKRTMSPAQLATLMKAAELRTKGSVCTATSMVLVVDDGEEGAV